MKQPMDKQKAVDFFSELYYGEHHIPFYEVKQCGYGWAVIDHGYLATFDSNTLTRLVLMAHRDCIRVEISKGGLKGVKICIHERAREGSVDERHPTIERALEKFNAK